MAKENTIVRIQINKETKARLHYTKHEFCFESMQDLYDKVFELGMDALDKRIVLAKAKYKIKNKIKRMKIETYFNPEDL